MWIRIKLKKLSKKLPCEVVKSLLFFLLLFFKFSLLDPDLGGKINADPLAHFHILIVLLS